GYFHTADDHEALLLRGRPVEDGAEPSGKAVSALNMLRMAELTDDEDARARAHALFAAFAAPTGAGAPGLEGLVGALDFALEPARQVVVVGPGPEALMAVVRRAFLPNRALVVVGAPADHTLAADKVAREGRATAYVCRRGRCERPTTDPAELERQLAAAPPSVD
ncbi:MAG: thioredoxin domain-containing protein, partial [Myxococcales bacterium]|nr:thioredoxin domain-containing protein [Myxococcales bacterium]